MATRINLLDWRTARRLRRRQEFLTRLGLGVGISLAVLALGYVTVAHEIETQDARNRFLTDQIG